MPVYSTRNSHWYSDFSSYGGLSSSEKIDRDNRGEYALNPAVLVADLQDDPLYLSKIMKGTDATNNYRNMFVRVTPGRMSGSFIASANFIDGSPNPSGKIHSLHRGSLLVLLPPVVTGYSHAATRDKAIARLRRKLDSVSGQMKAMPPLAESKDIYGLARKAIDLTGNVVGGLIDIKKGRFRDAFSRASDLWLTYSFAVSPTLNDIRQLGLSIESYLDRKPPVERFEGRANHSFNGSVKTSSINGARNAPLEATCQYSAEIRYSIVAGMDFTVYASNDYSVFEHLGITPYELVPTLWELTAFSWVMDYFGTIGDFLSDQFSTPAGNTIYCCESKKYRMSGLTCYDYKPSVGTSTLHKVTRPGSYEFVEFTRSKLPALPTRSLRFKTQDEIGMNALGKLFNLVAILGK